MNDFQAVAETYIATWNETDADQRAALLDRSWSADARYVDPLVAVTGRQDLSAAIGAVQQQFPGWRFRLAGPVDGHHNVARFGWELGPDGDGPAPVAGFDVATLTEDGRVAAVHGFLDRVPSA